jgi:hypothetical protein
MHHNKLMITSVLFWEIVRVQVKSMFAMVWLDHAEFGLEWHWHLDL